MSFFSSPSPVEKKVEAATSENYAEVPLELYLEIAEDIRKSQDAYAAADNTAQHSSRLHSTCTCLTLTLAASLSPLLCGCLLWLFGALHPAVPAT